MGISLESKELPLAETDLREGSVLVACRVDHGLGLFVKLSVVMGPVQLWKPAEGKSCSYLYQERIHWPGTADLFLRTPSSVFSFIARK